MDASMIYTTRVSHICNMVAIGSATQHEAHLVEEEELVEELVEVLLVRLIHLDHADGDKCELDLTQEESDKTTHSPRSDSPRSRALSAHRPSQCWRPVEQASA